MKKTIIGAVLVLFVALTLSLSLGKGKELAGTIKKPLVLLVEPWSRLRSQEVRPERAAPVADSDYIYVVTSRKKLVLFDLQGKKRSSVKINFAPTATPAVKNGLLFVPGDDGAFHCLQLPNGSELWSYPLKTIDFSPPTLTSHLVFFITGRDLVLALEQKTGRRVWEYQHLRSADLSLRGICPVAVQNGVVYAGFAGGTVAALDEPTGKLLWKREVFSGEQFMDVDAPLAVDETSVYAVSVGGRMAALSRKTGKIFWEYNAGGMAGLVLDGSDIFLANDEGEMKCLDKITGEVKWSTRLLSDAEGGGFLHLPTRPAVFDQFVLTVTRGGKLFVLDKNTGALTAQKNYHTDTSAPIVPINNTGFLFLDNKGVVRFWPHGL